MKTTLTDSEANPSKPRPWPSKRRSIVTPGFIGTLLVILVLRAFHKRGVLLPQLTQWQFLLLILAAGVVLVGLLALLARKRRSAAPPR